MDSEKAFDRVEWRYIYYVVKEFGIGNVFSSWLQLLYKDQSAMILSKRVSSRKIDIMRGVRQGCPLSPLLFPLALESLALAIHKSTNIRGFRACGLESRVALYADDVVCFLEDPVSSAKELYKLLDKFGNISGYKINKTKSIMSECNIPQEMIKYC